MTTKKTQYSCIAVNEYVNKYLFDVGDKHKELQMLMLAASGSGQRLGHKFPGVNKPGNVEKFIQKCFPLWKWDEIDMYLQMNNPDTIIQLAKDSGMQDKELKDLIKDVNKHYAV